MNGAIRTREKCCQPFQENSKGLRCPKCKARPETYYIDFWWKGDRIRVPRDKDGNIFTSYEAANRFLTVMRSKVDEKTFNPKDYIKVEVKKLEFATYAMAWVARRQKEVNQELLSRGYLRSATSYIENHMISFFQKRDIRDIHEGLIHDFKDELPAHLRPKTIKNIMATLQKIFSDAFNVRRDILRMPRFPKISVGKPDYDWIQKDDQEKILAEISDPVRKAFFIFMFQTAVRPGEARALRWKRVLWEIKKVVVCDAMDEEHFKDRTKEGDHRLIPLYPETIKALKAITQGDPEDFVFTFRGKPFNHKLIDKTWRRATQAAGIKIRLYHGTRHSAASQAVSAGADLKVVQAVLGHSCISSTQRYAHLHPSALLKFWDLQEDRHKTVTEVDKNETKILQLKGNKG
jgi:integrase